MNLRLDHLLEELRTRCADILRAIDADPLLLKRQSGELVLANAGPTLFTPQQPHQLYAKGVVYRRDPFEVVSLPLVKIYNLGERDVGEHLHGLAADPAAVLASLPSPSGSNPVLQYGGRWYTRAPELGEEALPRELRETVLSGQPALMRFDLDGSTQLAVGVPVASIDGAYFEISSLGELENTLESISISLLAAALLTTMAGAAVGFWAARRVLRPLRGIGQAAESLATGRLDTRVEASDDPDLAALAESFNEMAAALEERIERDASFASNVSHELRSPLMTLAASIEVMQNQRDDMPVRARAALDLMEADIDRFQQLVEDLLEISRFDAGVMYLDLEEVRVDELVLQAVQMSTDVDVPVDILGLGEHRDRRGGRVDAALGLGLGYALHAVRPALELEHGVRAVAADLERVRAVGRAQRLGLEAAPLGAAGDDLDQGLLDLVQCLGGDLIELAAPVLAPELEHDVGAARLAVGLDRGDAVLGRAGDRLAAVEERVGHLRLRGQPSSPLHRRGDGLELAHPDLRELEQRVCGALDVLELVREVHACDLTGALTARGAIGLVDRGDDGAADLPQRREKFLRVADAGERDYLAAGKATYRVPVRRQASAQEGPRRKASGEPVGVGSDQGHGIRPRERGAQRIGHHEHQGTPGAACVLLHHFDTRLRAISLIRPQRAGPRRG